MYDTPYHLVRETSKCCAVADVLDPHVSTRIDRKSKMVAARFELARDCSHRESRNLKSDALDQLGHATPIELSSDASIYAAYLKWSAEEPDTGPYTRPVKYCSK